MSSHLVDVAAQIVRVQVGLPAVGGLGKRNRTGSRSTIAAATRTAFDHLALGVAGVDVVTEDGDHGRVGAEGLVFDLAEVGAVEGVGVVGAEAGDVEVLGAAPDLLVSGEGDPHRTVKELGMVAAARPRPS